MRKLRAGDVKTASSDFNTALSHIHHFRAAIKAKIVSIRYRHALYTAHKQSCSCMRTEKKKSFFGYHQIFLVTYRNIFELIFLFP